MLASKVESLADIVYPVWASPKLDGVRCIIIEQNGNPTAVSRNWKNIQNSFTRKWLEENCKIGMDGELMVRVELRWNKEERVSPSMRQDGHENTDLVKVDVEFSQVTSGIMSEDGEPDFYIALFDYVKNDISMPFTQRLKDLKEVVASMPDKSHVKIVPQVLIHTAKELEAFRDKCIADGYEGAMIRSPSSPYKCGRSSLLEGYLLKLKLFDDDEGLIIGFTEQMENTNKAEKDAFGNTERSSKKAGLVAKNTLGALEVKDLKTGVTFGIGTGFDDEQRKYIWENQKKFRGKIIEYTHQGLGVNNAPRFPAAKKDKKDKKGNLVFRDPRDMSE